MAELSSLLTRLEKAEGPDRGIDRDIADTFGFGPDESWARPNHQPGIHCMDVGDWTKGNRARASVRYTSSVDAALALAAHLHPNEPVLMGMRQSPETLPWARIGKWARPDATGATLAIAICLAITCAARATIGGDHG